MNMKRVLSAFTMLFRGNGNARKSLGRRVA